MASKLFKTCVLPAFEYGMPIWGASNFPRMAKDRTVLEEGS